MTKFDTKSSYDSEDFEMPDASDLPTVARPRKLSLVSRSKSPTKRVLEQSSNDAKQPKRFPDQKINVETKPSHELSTVQDIAKVPMSTTSSGQDLKSPLKTKINELDTPHICTFFTRVQELEGLLGRDRKRFERRKCRSG